MKNIKGKPDEFLKNFDELVNKLDEYLCFSSIETCIKKKYLYEGNYILVDENLDVVNKTKGGVDNRIFQLVDENLDVVNKTKGGVDNRIFQLSDNTVKDITGAPIPDPLVVGFNIEPQTTLDEINRDLDLDTINRIVDVYNVVLDYSTAIYSNFTDIYVEPIKYDPLILEKGPTFWFFYQYLFHDATAAFTPNKTEENPLLHLLQSGNFGIFLRVFLIATKFVESDKKFLSAGGKTYISNRSFYDLWKKLSRSALDHGSKNSREDYQSIIQNTYRGEETINADTLEKTVDTRNQASLLVLFDKIYTEITDKNLVDDNLVRIKNSSFFTNFVKPRSETNKLAYYVSYTQDLIDSISRSFDSIREFLKIHYTWLLISMITSNSGNYEAVVIHTMFYMRRMLGENLAYRSFPISRLYHKLFGKNISFISHNFNFTAIPNCSIACDDKRIAMCVEVSILNILRYILRQDEKPYLIDQNKLSKIPKGSSFHSKIHAYFERYVDTRLYSSKDCESFANILQKNSILKEFYRNTYNNTELTATEDTVVAVLSYTVYKDDIVFSPGKKNIDREDMDRFFAKLNADFNVTKTSLENDGLLLDDLLECRILRDKHVEVQLTTSDTIYEGKKFTYVKYLDRGQYPFFYRTTLKFYALNNIQDMRGNLNYLILSLAPEITNEIKDLTLSTNKVSVEDKFYDSLLTNVSYRLLYNYQKPKDIKQTYVITEDLPTSDLGHFHNSPVLVANYLDVFSKYARKQNTVGNIDYQKIRFYFFVSLLFKSDYNFLMNSIDKYGNWFLLNLIEVMPNIDNILRNYPIGRSSFWTNVVFCTMYIRFTNRDTFEKICQTSLSVVTETFYDFLENAPNSVDLLILLLRIDPNLLISPNLEYHRKIPTMSVDQLKETLGGCVSFFFKNMKKTRVKPVEIVDYLLTEVEDFQTFVDKFSKRESSIQNESSIVPVKKIDPGVMKYLGLTKVDREKYQYMHNIVDVINYCIALLFKGTRREIVEEVSQRDYIYSAISYANEGIKNASRHFGRFSLTVNVVKESFVEALDIYVANTTLAILYLRFLQKNSYQKTFVNIVNFNSDLLDATLMLEEENREIYENLALLVLRINPHTILDTVSRDEKNHSLYQGIFSKFRDEVNDELRTAVDFLLEDTDVDIDDVVQYLNTLNDFQILVDILATSQFDKETSRVRIIYDGKIPQYIKDALEINNFGKQEKPQTGGYRNSNIYLLQQKKNKYKQRYLALKQKLNSY